MRLKTLAELITTLMVVFIAGILVSAAESSEECNDPGPKCDQTCQKLGYCVNSTDSVDWVLLRDCQEKFCGITTDKKLKCQATPDPTCNLTTTEKILCGTPGVFPSLLNANQYFYCGKDLKVSPPYSCPSDKKYDPCFGNCTTVSSTYPKCTTTEEFGAIAVVNNNASYYLCVDDSGTTVPKFYTCPKGTFSTIKCDDTQESTCKTLQTTVVCNSAGNIPDVRDCEMYYQCSAADVKPIHRVCASGQIFNTLSMKCEVGSCG